MTLTGLSLCDVESLPSRPSPPLPQHLATPELKSAQEELAPAAIVTAELKSWTSTGEVLFVVVLLPSWPELFQPQHFAVPVLKSAQLCKLPAEISIAPLMPTTS